jgi:hypothetical protein
MALGPIPSPTSPVQPAPARDVSAAQRAFFRAALERVQSASATAPATSPSTPAPAVQASEPPPDPMRNYRPGRLLDIKV